MRVRVSPGVLRLAVGESATPPVLGTGDRRFDSCRPDLLAERGRGAAVLASLMSSRPWVRIPPAQFGGVAQRREHSLVRREAAGSSPVVPVYGIACRCRSTSWWLWCNGSIRGREPRGTGSNPVGRPYTRMLSIGELSGL